VKKTKEKLVSFYKKLTERYLSKKFYGKIAKNAK